MTNIRPQYHFRSTDQGLIAWDVRRLIEMSRGFPVRMVDPRDVLELDENHWYSDPSNHPTPRSILEHMQLILACDLSYPIILADDGRVMDGMHRVCKAVLQDHRAIPAVQFPQTPDPDYIDCVPEDLPYEERNTS